MGMRYWESAAVHRLLSFRLLAEKLRLKQMCWYRLIQFLSTNIGQSEIDINQYKKIDK